MHGEFSIVPDARFVELKTALAERLTSTAASITPQNFPALLDPLMRSVLEQGFCEATAHEGTIWLLDQSGTHLVPAYNTGPHAERLVGKFKQPLNEGLICMVLTSEQPFLENEVYKNSKQSKYLDATLGVQTSSLIAVPLHFFQICQGVISCVQLKSPGTPDPPGFAPPHLAAVQRASAILARLLEFRLLGESVAWTSG